MARTPNPLAIVTGASSGIGLELARLAAEDRYDLIVAADDGGIVDAAASLEAHGVAALPIQADLATDEGVEQVMKTAEDTGRPIELLCANAGHGLGRAFLDREWPDLRHVIDTNVTGTVELVHRVGRQMRSNRKGKILLTGSIAGYIPGTFQAVYNATKAFIDSFAEGLRAELKGSGVTVTCLMPGATETAFFERADLMDTKIGTTKKDDPAQVAKAGYQALKKGKPSVIFGLKNKLEVASSAVLPKDTLAEMHRKQAAPGTAKKK
jgi:short-subunit dehydrogenase